MTETVTITGDNLAVAHDQAQPDPKRIRPARFAPSVVDKNYRPLEKLIGHNPYWTDAANNAADTSSESPAVLARRWAAHRIEPKENADGSKQAA